MITTYLSGNTSRGIAKVRPWLLVLTLCWIVAACSPESPQKRSMSEDGPPRLVVGIMVDQMRYDYLYRYWDKYGDNGFRRLLGEGFSFDNARFNYLPTFTSPGHASVYTGTTPSIHGIIGNYWYDREAGRLIYVTEDADKQTVGAQGKGGQMSPHRLLATTVGDELKLHNQRSRVIGVSLKDRSAILPAGHTGEAYWLDYDSGRFVTSTHYRDTLPEWVSRFNDEGQVDNYLSRNWETLLPIEQYVESIADDNPYETPFYGAEKSVFPHELPLLKEIFGRRLIAHTPFGDELLTSFVLAALQEEELGRGDAPDMLAISYSAPDHIGHQFGPASVEVQDTYLRLDRQLALLLDYLDQEYGRDNVLVFLTSDHGVPHIPQYLADQRIPAGYVYAEDVEESLREFSQQRYGADVIEAYSSHDLQVFLDRGKLAGLDLSPREVQEEIAGFLLQRPGVAGALPAHALAFGEFTRDIRAKVQRGYHQKRSGDVVLWLEPNWIPHLHELVRTTHGAGYSYDTRAPLIWYGWQVPAGRSTEPVFITDIAPTLAVIMNSPFPAAVTGNPLNQLLQDPN